MGYKSYAQQKRESYDYRRAYLKHHPGIFGSFYICSQCGKILVRSSMEVDHIFPVSKWWSVNRVINCVAICSRCNKHKSDRITTAMSVKAILMKILEELYILIHKLILLLLQLLFLGLALGIRMMIRPLFTQRSVSQKIVIVACYGYIGLLFVRVLLGG
ncbi:hypothetical protein [Clostridium paraputrificum]|uniref:HNH endonuclease n=1 Tax=Clostridium paraputrificum TaxID=29363 RepID=A0A6N3FA83_9CLOT